jgi:hypothetical protein
VRRLIALLVACLLLAACATRPPGPAVVLPALRLAPSALGHDLAVQQRLVFRFGSHVRELDALLEVDASDVRLAVQAMGRTGVRLQWDGKELVEQRAAWLPSAVRGERVLDDVQFSLWPADAIRAVLPAGWELVERDGFRELRRNGQVWLQREQVDATTLRVRNGVDDYELMIESVAGGVHDP